LLKGKKKKQTGRGGKGIEVIPEKMTKKKEGIKPRVIDRRRRGGALVRGA